MNYEVASLHNIKPIDHPMRSLALVTASTFQQNFFSSHCDDATYQFLFTSRQNK